MKKRIFISIHYMEIGGAERSLLGLLNAIDASRYDVDLFIHQHTGEFMTLIPRNVHLLPEIRKYSALERPILNILFEGHFAIVIARLLAKCRASKYIIKNGLKDHFSVFQYIANATTPLLPSLRKYGEYDLAISFHAPHNIVKEKVTAKKKIAWIHTDYSSIHVNVNLELPVWDSYDFIVSLSDSVSYGFIKTFPSLKDKIVMIDNILSPSFVREQAHAFDVSKEIPTEDKIIKICSVGRFTFAKNFDNVPFICKILIDAGLRIKWYIIGYGGEEDLIRKRIEETEMQGKVILLGKKSNPYPYINACDIYVQPSRYEGKALTVREAQILNKLVVISDFPTAKDQIKNGFDGMIVPMDNKGLAEGLKQVIENPSLQELIISNVKKNDYGNENEVEKIYQLL